VPTICIADLINALKRTPRWVHQEILNRGSLPGRRAAAFSQQIVGKAVVAYIRNQDEHHRQNDFRDEF
jgi:hypothetical protein